MLFNSLAFAFFLPVMFAGNWILASRSTRARNLWLLAGSYFFYACWDWRFLSLIIISSLVDYLIGNAISRRESQSGKKYLLLISLGVNLGILGIFKYFNFFVASFSALLTTIGIEASSPTLSVILPVGISFYTFQTLSYTLDIYRGKLKPTQDPIVFFTFVAFFPQLVAGPIERARHLLPQFFTVTGFSRPKAVSGLQLILWGLFKKVVIADNLARIVDPVFAQSEMYQGAIWFIAVVAFAIQIYCDFSGYSDIAIGVARTLGFDLMTNFRFPYFARSFRTFWSRWHISLSTWFRDYVYISLGGNRVSQPVWMRNILITFLLSGLWHGAGFTFIIWGMVHAVYYIIEVVALKKRTLPLVPGVLLTFAGVCLAWVFFRAASVSEAMYILGNMFSFSAGGASLSGLIPAPEYGYLLLSFGLFILMESWTAYHGDLAIGFARVPRPVRWGSYMGLAGWILLFGAYQAPQPFIYFQF